MKYYSTQRPVVPGSYPRIKGNDITEICNYDRKTYIKEIGREAWGYVEYLYSLLDKDVSDYELTPECGKENDNNGYCT